MVMVTMVTLLCCYVFLLAALSFSKDVVAALATVAALAALAVLTGSERLRLASDAAAAALGSARRLGG